MPYISCRLLGQFPRGVTVGKRVVFFDSQTPKTHMGRAAHKPRQSSGHVSWLTVVNYSGGQWRSPRAILGGSMSNGLVHGLLSTAEWPCLMESVGSQGVMFVTYQPGKLLVDPAPKAMLESGHRAVTGLSLCRVTPRTCVFWPSVSSTTRRCTTTQTLSSSTS